MKMIFVYVMTGLISVFSVSCEKEAINQSCGTNYSGHPKNEKYLAVLEKYIDKGLTGISVTVHTPQEIWTGATGFANVEEQLNLTPCDPQYAASIQKTLISVVTLQLIQEGKLNFDSKIEPFLSYKIKEYVPNYDQITIKHLLMHTSGMHDVVEEAFVNDLLADPMASFTNEELLAYVKEPGAIDIPGARHYYSDANYILLSIIIDSITGSHIKAVEDRILNPLHMNSSTYHNKDYPHPQGLVNSYWNSPIDGSFENISDFQNHITQQLFGSDGLITTSTDLDKFTSALFKGNLISDEMKTLIKTEKVRNQKQNQKL